MYNQNVMLIYFEEGKAPNDMIGLKILVLPRTTRNMNAESLPNFLRFDPNEEKIIIGGGINGNANSPSHFNLSPYEKGSNGLMNKHILFERRGEEWYLSQVMGHRRKPIVINNKTMSTSIKSEHMLVNGDCIKICGFSFEWYNPYDKNISIVKMIDPRSNGQSWGEITDTDHNGWGEAGKLEFGTKNYTCPTPNYLPSWSVEDQTHISAEKWNSLSLSSNEKTNISDSTINSIPGFPDNNMNKVYNGMNFSNEVTSLHDNTFDSMSKTEIKQQPIQSFSSESPHMSSNYLENQKKSNYSSLPNPSDSTFIPPSQLSPSQNQTTDPNQITNQKKNQDSFKYNLYKLKTNQTNELKSLLDKHKREVEELHILYGIPFSTSNKKSNDQKSTQNTTYIEKTPNNPLSPPSVLPPSPNKNFNQPPPPTMTHNTQYPISPPLPPSTNQHPSSGMVFNPQYGNYNPQYHIPNQQAPTTSIPQNLLHQPPPSISQNPQYPLSNQPPPPQLMSYNPQSQNPQYPLSNQPPPHSINQHQPSIMYNPQSSNPQYPLSNQPPPHSINQHQPSIMYNHQSSNPQYPLSNQPPPHSINQHQPSIMYNHQNPISNQTQSHSINQPPPPMTYNPQYPLSNQHQPPPPGNTTYPNPLPNNPQIPLNQPLQQYYNK